MSLRIFCIIIHYIFLHLATCLHVVNLYAHGPIYINMHALKKEEISCNYFEKLNYLLWSLLNPCRNFYYHWSVVNSGYISWLLSRMSIWSGEITNALWDSLHEKNPKLWLRNIILHWKSNFQACMSIDRGIMLLYKQ